MANELKLCPFCGSEPSSSFTDMKAVIKCEPCGFAMEHSTAIVSLRVAEDVQRRVVTKRWNTRPAAPVEGLETYMRADFGTVDLVTRSQAEAIIAVKDKLIQSLIDLDSDEVKRLETDNAALTARVEELTSPEYLKKKLNQVGVVDKEWKDRAEALETQLAAARKALEFYADASKWDDGYFKSEDDGTVIRAYPSSIEKDQGDKARDTLEDKP